jgi:hypothetical protein
MAGAVHVLRLPALPPSLNVLTRGRLRSRMRQSASWGTAVAVLAREAAIPHAAGRRRVSLLLTYPPARRRHDPDAFWKAVLDGLVCCGLLVNDSARWVALGPVEYARGEHESTEIILEDL